MVEGHRSGHALPPVLPRYPVRSGVKSRCDNGAITRIRSAQRVFAMSAPVDSGIVSERLQQGAKFVLADRHDADIDDWLNHAIVDQVRKLLIYMVV